MCPKMSKEHGWFNAHCRLIPSVQPVKRFAQLENAQRRECKADLLPPAKIAGKF